MEWTLLALILLAGAAFRFTGVNWDNGHHLHPDERFLTMVVGAIRPGLVMPSPKDAPPQIFAASLRASYFDTARSGLNPHNVGYGFFVYGTFPLFAVHGLAAVFQAVDYNQVHLFGRVLSALSDLITVALIYLVGRRLYDSRVGLLAAALLAFCVMHIQQAHFFVFDSFLVTLVVACFYFCVDIAETGRRRSFALAGLFLGLSLATKLSMLVFLPIVALAALIYLWRTALAGSNGSGRLSGLDSQAIVTLWHNGALERVISGGVLALAVTALVFRICQPYAFAGPGFFNIRLSPRWLENIAYQAKTQNGTVDLPPSIQWAGTEPLLFPWRHMVAWGMGLPLGLAAWGGFVAATLIVLWRGRWQHLLVLSWSGLCFVYFASVLNKTMRYLLPAYPFFILLAAWGLLALYRAARRAELAPTASHDGAAALPRWSEGWSERWSRGASPLRDGPWPAPVGQHTVRRWAPRAALALMGFVVAASALWSFAFTRIYTRSVTREAASLWIYQQVPQGSVLANEHWDDPLPVPIAPYNAGLYRGPQLPMYDRDEPKKVETLVQMLTQADYINLTSNRLYGSIPRMPQRYPMSSEYYRRLFAGDLGFELVKTFTSYPAIGPWVIADDRAEEAFTVYDHPKVLIFQKQPDFSPDRVRQILGAVPLDEVVQVPPVQAGRTQLLLPPVLREANTAGGTWSLMFNLSGLENRLAPLVWWLILQALGLVAAPLVWLVLSDLPDRGYGLAKPLGLLAVSWIAWSLAGFHLLPWTRFSLLLAVIMLAATSGLVLRRRGAEWLAWVRAHGNLILTTECVFLGAFLLLTLFRMANPDLWHPARGGEKPMEFSYLNAVIKTAYFPPYDPWFAGGYLNYYYFGYVLVAAVSKLTGVVPSISFNLAVSALYALTACGCFSFAYNLSRLGGRQSFGFKAALGAGVAGFVLVAFVGNLDGCLQLLQRLARAGQGSAPVTLPIVSGLGSVAGGLAAVLTGQQPLEPFDFWRSSRIIPNNTINEFPFWTFLFADLHAHLISLPYQVATLGMLLNLASRRYGAPGPIPTGKGGQGGQTPATPFPLTASAQGVQERTLPVPEGGEVVRWFWSLLGWRRVGEILLFAWMLGALYVINTWEFPTYALLIAGTFVIAERGAPRGLTIAGLVRAGTSAAGVLLLAKAFFRPFWRYYETFYSSITLWTTDKSRLDHYLIIHGLFVFLLATMVLMLAYPTWRQTGWGRYLATRGRYSRASARFRRLERAFALRRRAPATGYLALWGTSLPLVLALVLLGYPLIAFLTAVLAATVAMAYERRESPPLLFASFLVATGLALSIFVEFFTLQGDIGRMNTVFKFYLQIWVMWGLVSAVSLAWALQRLFTGDVAARDGVASGAEVQAVFATPAHCALLYETPATAGHGDGDSVDWPASEREGASGERADRLRHGARTEHQPLTLAVAPLAWWQWTWLGGGSTLLLAVLAFPLGATPARLADRFHPLPATLDGMAYMKETTFLDASSEVTRNSSAGGPPGPATGATPRGAAIRASADYEAIQWLLANVQGSPVVLEASIPEYRWGSRVAKYTGLPTVLGWRWHQVQQRGTYAPMVDQRLRDVQTMFDDPSISRVTSLLTKYRVRYIYVGDLERAYYAAAGLAKFDQMTQTLRPVYRQSDVTIYEVVTPTSAPNLAR